MQNSFETPPTVIYVDYHTHVESFDVGWKTGYDALVLEVKNRFAFHSSDDFFLSCIGNGGDASPGLITVNTQDALDAFLAKAPTLPPLLTLHPTYLSLGRTFTIEMGAHPSYELFEIHTVLEMPTRLDILRLAKSRFNALPALEEIELYLVSRGGFVKIRCEEEWAGTAWPTVLAAARKGDGSAARFHLAPLSLAPPAAPPHSSSSLGTFPLFSRGLAAYAGVDSLSGKSTMSSHDGL